MVEQVKYKILEKIGKIEIRLYPLLVIAKVDGYGDGGFNLLFRFITGNNRQKSEISMTAPVVSEQIAMTAPVLSETGSLAFIMPDGFSLETTPEPLDDRVKIIEVPERIVAALRFSGRSSNSIFKKKSEELLAETEHAGLKVIGQVFSMRYNGPFTPWFLRRNEVAAEVELPRPLLKTT
ncbi:TPA: heme-binding protein [Candidatus Bathyarchaeota archaeon]|nr:heme-binding protein [Candidatus Bathyarchaeota archaeon]